MTLWAVFLWNWLQPQAQTQSWWSAVRSEGSVGAEWITIQSRFLQVKFTRGVRRKAGRTGNSVGGTVRTNCMSYHSQCANNSSPQSCKLYSFLSKKLVLWRTAQPSSIPACNISPCSYINKDLNSQYFMNESSELTSLLNWLNVAILRVSPFSY